MARRCGLFIFVLSICLLTSCQRAQQYPAVSRPKVPPKKEDVLPYGLSWTALEKREDVPILFVPSSKKAEWDRLPAFWNVVMPAPSGMATIHLGQNPLEALASLRLMAEHQEVIKIRVPLGLPDPTHLIPASNPPTLAAWRLGKRLFHEPRLVEKYACASCHDPRQGFSDGRAHPGGGSYNTLSLINVVYNRRQFWDGRVQSLEETIVRSLNDERPVDAKQRKALGLSQHIWGGFARSLHQEKSYDEDFRLAFGSDHASQDTIAKALATYLRTILSGDSLHDRIAAQSAGKGLLPLMPQDFENYWSGLKDAKLSVLAFLRDDTRARKDDEVPLLLAKGYELFHGKARCAQCHPGPLFTDQDFHNIGYPGDEGAPPAGMETGRATHVPIGLKDLRLNGAFRTPTLRNLVKTMPYMHNGSLAGLPQVIAFYDDEVQFTNHLARALLDGDREQKLRLSADEKDALVIFLRSLEGRSVDPTVADAVK